MVKRSEELAVMSQVLVDIGGTSIRLGWQSQKAEDIRDPITYACRDFASPVGAIRQYCDQNQLKVDRVVLAVAAEISGVEVNITNNHWIFNAEELAQELGANEYLLINDFTAQAFSNSALLSPKPSINPQHHILLRKGVQAAGSPLLVTGPGTGLGVAALLPSNIGPMVIEGEGGHVSFAPRDEGERNILEVLAAEFGHVSGERLVSGPGLETIYKIENDTRLAAPEIGDGALAGDDKCLKAVNLMFKSFATVVANAALSFGAGFGGGFGFGFDLVSVFRVDGDECLDAVKNLLVVLRGFFSRSKYEFSGLVVGPVWNVPVVVSSNIYSEKKTTIPRYIFKIAITVVE